MPALAGIGTPRRQIRAAALRDDWFFATLTDRADPECEATMARANREICLSMIVRNEAPVIERSLASVLPVIDHWVIVDTGSTDGTQDIIRRFFAGRRPGSLHERPWRDFGHNRTEALELARAHGEYSLIIDADDELLPREDLTWAKPDADAYEVDILDGGVVYQRTQIVKNALNWRYEGVLHEFLACDQATTVGRAPFAMRRHHDGRRRRDPETYRKDAAILERAAASETNDFLRARYVFYLAQSYRDAGEPDRAIGAYLRRAEMGHWDQEVYYALLQAGRLIEAEGRSDQALSLYRRASTICPRRTEAAHAASRLCRNLGRFSEGFELAKPAIGLWPPDEGLFIEPWIYLYGLLDEYAVNAYWAGHYRECVEAARTILARRDVPFADRERTTKNLGFALGKLGWRPGVESARPSSRAASSFRPDRPLGGTEIMWEGLRARLGSELEAISLHVNVLGEGRRPDKPLVAWMHHDVDQQAVQWCRDPSLTASVSAFVFVSYWQRERYLAAFGLPPERCVVLRNATSVPPRARDRRGDEPTTVAYASTPNRGLSVLLDAWEALAPPRASLEIWSSMALYGPRETDDEYLGLFDRATRIDGVTYRGLLTNEALRERLGSVDILAYPSTFRETSCLSVIEAMAAGCRIVCPSLGALPETTFDCARVYPAPIGHFEHAVVFARQLGEELADPWRGDAGARRLQHEICQFHYDWSRRVEDWRRLILDLRR